MFVGAGNLSFVVMTAIENTVYDLIIVGAGPAGATAALYAQRQGLKTLLLDKDRFPRDKICGDALSGKSVAILLELGLLEQVRALPGAAINRIVFGSPDHSAVDIDLSQHVLHSSLTDQELPMEGFVIRRQVFDHFLFQQAQQVADACVEEFSVRDLVFADGQVCGVRGRKAGSDEEVEYRGRVVLGCEGFNSVVARKTGLYRHESEHWLVALRCYYENVKGLTDQIELHFVDEILPGYFWIFPLENGYANVGIGLGHNEIKGHNTDLKEALRQVIASDAFCQRFAQARPLEEPVGWNLPIGSKRRQVHGAGFLLLGDAAGLIDPFTGEGIANALYSARFAVQAVAEACAANDFSAAFLRRYEQRLWASLGDELKISTQLRRLGQRRSLMNLVIRKAARNAEVSDLICGMLANSVPRRRLVNPLFYLRLLLR